jgi:ribonucleotide monophosphatase NagD (HAD superfamily)
MAVKQRIAIDFDGTIWDGTKILDSCIETLTRWRADFNIAIFSSRATEQEREQMKQILDTNKVPYDSILGIKPTYDFLIDDKARQFTSWDKLSL